MVGELVEAELDERFLGETEEVRDLVEDRRADLPHQVRFVGEVPLQRLAEESDLIRHLESVAAGPLA